MFQTSEVKIYEFQDVYFSKINDVCLKWIHMAQYGLILKLDGAHRIISGPHLTHKNAYKRPQNKN